MDPVASFLYRQNLGSVAEAANTHPILLAEPPTRPLKDVVLFVLEVLTDCWLQAYVFVPKLLMIEALNFLLCAFPKYTKNPGDA